MTTPPPGFVDAAETLEAEADDTDEPLVFDVYGREVEPE